MRYSRAFLPTLKEAPADADTASARLMLRAGLVRKVAAGLYEWLPLGLRVLRKVERIVREEMDRAGGQEVWLPFVQPRDLWEESGRWTVYGKEMLRLKDRKDTDFCLAPTAEEVMTDLVRREVRSYKELPLLLYQFGTKFRDEIRPRFGVMRAREFYMKDAYSFHADEASAEAVYKEVFEAYNRIFARCGLRFRPVEAETGPIGGSFSHEFMVLAETGEEIIAACAGCGYAANLERAEGGRAGAPGGEPSAPVEEVATPGQRTIEEVASFLGVPPERMIKTLLYVADGKPAAAALRGDMELNEAKFQRALGAAKLHKMPEEEVRRIAGCEPGFAGPIGLAAELVVDPTARVLADAVAGANKTGLHLRHVRADRDFPGARTADIRRVKEGEPCGKCEHPLSFHRGIEVGHTFKLGTKYSVSMKAGFLTERGEKAPFVMGCYGIGVSRVVAAAIEQGHDADGIRWPEALAPFDVTVLPLGEEARVREAAERLERELVARGLEPLVDDRDQRAGVKFKDADLLGIPWRVTVGERKLAQGLVEIKARSETAARDVPLERAVEALLEGRVVT